MGRKGRTIVYISIGNDFSKQFQVFDPKKKEEATIWNYVEINLIVSI